MLRASMELLVRCLILPDLAVNGLQSDRVYFVLHRHLQDETALRAIEREPVSRCDMLVGQTGRSGAQEPTGYSSMERNWRFDRQTDSIGTRSSGDAVPRLGRLIYMKWRYMWNLMSVRARLH